MERNLLLTHQNLFFSLLVIRQKTSASASRDDEGKLKNNCQGSYSRLLIFLVTYE
jgi:hypothetical protein